MWQNNRKVTRTYASAHSKNAYGMITGIAGWLKISGLSTDGVTNVFAALNSALANNREVDVYVVSNEIERIVVK